LKFEFTLSPARALSPSLSLSLSLIYNAVRIEICACEVTTEKDFSSLPLLALVPAGNIRGSFLVCFGQVVELPTAVLVF
jgi:hypothetical protein